MADALTIALIVSARDEASEVLAGIQDQIDKLAGTIDEGIGGAAGVVDKLDESFKGLSDQLVPANEQLSLLEKGATGVGEQMAFFEKEAGTSAETLGKLDGSAQGVVAEFRAMLEAVDGAKGAFQQLNDTMLGGLDLATNMSDSVYALAAAISRMGEDTSIASTEMMKPDAWSAVMNKFAISVDGAAGAIDDLDTQMAPAIEDATIYATRLDRMAESAGMTTQALLAYFNRQQEVTTETQAVTTATNEAVAAAQRYYDAMVKAAGASLDDATRVQMLAEATYGLNEADTALFTQAQKAAEALKAEADGVTSVNTTMREAPLASAEFVASTNSILKGLGEQKTALQDIMATQQKMADEGVAAYGEASAAVQKYGAATTETAGEVDAASATIIRTNGLVAKSAEDTAVKSEASSGFSLTAFDHFALGVAIVGGAIGYESIKMASNFQSATTAIANSAGTSVQAAQKVANAFLNATKLFSGTQLAQAFAGVAGQFKTMNGQALDAGEALTIMTNASNLAAASGGKLSNNTHDLANAMMVFHIQTGMAGNAADIMWNTGKALGLTTDQLSSSFSRLQPFVAGTGMSLANAASIMLELGKSTGTGTYAMRVAGTAIQNLVSPTAAATTVMDNLGISVDNSQGKFIGIRAVIGELHDAMARLPGPAAAMAATQKLAGDAAQMAGLKTQTQTTAVKAQEAALTQSEIPLKAQAAQLSKNSLMVDLFSKNAGAMAAVVAGGVPAFDAATRAVSQHGTAAAAAAAKAKTLHGELTQLKSRVSDLGVEIGTALIPPLTHIVGAVLPVVTAMSSFASKNKDVTVALAGLVGLLLIAVGAIKAVTFVMKTYGEVTKIAGAVSKLFGSSQAEMAGVTDASTASVEGQSVALGASSGAFLDGSFAVDEYATSEVAADAASVPLIASMLAIAAAALLNPWTWIIIGIVAAIAAIVLIVTHFNTFKAVMLDVWNVLKEAGPVFLLVLVPPIGMLILLIQHFGLVKQAAEDAWDGIKAAWSVVSGFFSGIGTDILDAFTSLWSLVKAGFTQDWDDIKSVWNVVIGFFQNIGTSVSTALTNAMNRVKGIFTSVWDDIQAAWNAAVSFFTGIVTGIESAFSGIASKLGGYAKDAWNAITKAFSTVYDTAKGWVLDMVAPFFSLGSSIIGAIGSVGSLLIGIGESIINGLTAGIESALKHTYSVVAGIAGHIKSLKGPESYDIQLLVSNGQAIMKGLETGINLGFQQSVAPALHGVTNSIPGEVTAPTSSLGGGGGQPTINVNLYMSGAVYGNINQFLNDIGRKLATELVPASGTRLVA